VHGLCEEAVQVSTPLSTITSPSFRRPDITRFSAVVNQPPKKDTAQDSLVRLKKRVGSRKRVVFPRWRIGL
jgi:hypothetical protein